MCVLSSCTRRSQGELKRALGSCFRRATHISCPDGTAHATDRAMQSTNRVASCECWSVLSSLFLSSYILLQVFILFSLRRLCNDKLVSGCRLAVV